MRAKSSRVRVSIVVSYCPALTKVIPHIIYRRPFWMFRSMFLLPREILFVALTNFSGFLFNSHIFCLNSLYILFHLLKKSLNEGRTYGWRKTKNN
jgi:hypothetical protein